LGWVICEPAVKNCPGRGAQNVELLRISNQMLELTKAVHEATASHQALPERATMNSEVAK